MAGLLLMSGLRGSGLGNLELIPDVWTDGSLVRDEVSGVCCGGAGVFAFTSGSNWFSRSWGHLELLPPDRDRDDRKILALFFCPKTLANCAEG